MGTKGSAGIAIRPPQQQQEGGKEGPQDVLIATAETHETAVPPRGRALAAGRNASRAENGKRAVPRALGGNRGNGSFWAAAGRTRKLLGARTGAARNLPSPLPTGFTWARPCSCGHNDARNVTDLPPRARSPGEKEQASRRLLAPEEELRARFLSRHTSRGTRQMSLRTSRS
ncbi:hypothetical protein HPB50_003369 [Hyalomma asiaticum]|uniref:Uncharacterized protein n=1 Tax=Hyalomma asiaticum TaxID=266040 RepID=A0ACB7TC19_HYAAI|nr:hypothetical protein HPB50_003369 [Hyalomma asiaticum]